MAIRLGGSLTFASALFAFGCVDHTSTQSDPGTSVDRAPGKLGASASFSITPLVSDLQSLAPRVDPNLVNAWGIVGYDEVFWIADNGTGMISVYDGAGNAAMADGKITLVPGIDGVAINETDKFLIKTGATTCGPATLIVASETGQIFGVDTDHGNVSGVLVDRSDVGAIYKGVAIIRGADGAPLMLAADFHNGRIDVFDGDLRLVTHVSFQLANPPPQVMSPFNVMAFGDTVFVAFAVPDADRHDEVAGPGFGLIAAFDVSGNQKFVLNGQTLNAPWGMAMSACDFGSFQNVMLVGNFGDGTINAVDAQRGSILGQLVDNQGAAISVDGLWGLSFGGGVGNNVAGALYFAAGTNDEADGLFGYISAK